MGDKKGKALALELMDDLLNEGNEKTTATRVEAAPKKHKAKESTKVVQLEDSQSEDFDFSLSAQPMESSADQPSGEIEMGTAVELGPKTEVAHQTDVAHHTDVANKTDISDSPPLKEEKPRVQAGDDRTEMLSHSQIHNPPVVPATKVTAVPRSTPPPPSVRASVGRYGGARAVGSTSASEAALAQSENLRIAQVRLTEFEQEIERLRLQNEELAAAAETLRRRTDELTASNQKRERDYQHAVGTFRQEKEILTNSKEAVQRTCEELKQKNEELELRISTNIQKIRVRERELENRLELMKMESSALIRSKDEMVLDLKRQIDQLNLEINNFRAKNQELNRQTSDKQEMLRRTVKALRLALSMLEGEEEAPPAVQRKAK